MRYLWKIAFGFSVFLLLLWILMLAEPTIHVAILKIVYRSQEHRMLDDIGRQYRGAEIFDVTATQIGWGDGPFEWVTLFGTYAGCYRAWYSTDGRRMMEGPLLLSHDRKCASEVAFAREWHLEHIIPWNLFPSVGRSVPAVPLSIPPLQVPLPVRSE